MHQPDHRGNMKEDQAHAHKCKCTGPNAVKQYAHAICSIHKCTKVIYSEVEGSCPKSVSVIQFFQMFSFATPEEAIFKSK